jgi:hypothetical protein
MVVRKVQVSKKPTKRENQEIILYLNNLVLYHAMKLNYTAFIQKAQNGSDSFGDTWPALKPKTIQYKKKKRYFYAGKVAINIRTRKLLHAMKPGYFRNGKYLPPPNQKVRVTVKNISVEIVGPWYVENVDGGTTHVPARPIFVLDLDALIDRALEKAIPLFQAYLKRRNLSPPPPPSFLDRKR